MVEFEFREPEDTPSEIAVVAFLVALSRTLEEISPHCASLVLDGLGKNVEILISGQSYLTLEDEVGIRAMNNVVRRRTG